MKELYIGRIKGENDVVLENEKVSRIHHCKCVLRDDGILTITDLGSTNGVFIDGKKITEETIVKNETRVKIGNVDITGSDVKKWFEALELDLVAQSNKMKQKYDDLCKRYRNNLIELKKVMELRKDPFVQVFPSDDEKVSYLVEDYTRKMHEAMDMLQLISKSSRKDAISFRDDMDTLADICNKAKGLQKEQCLDVRGYIYDQMVAFQKESLQEVTVAFQKLCGYYQTTFTSFYETTTTSIPVWETINNKRIIALPYLLYGFQDLRFPFFEESLDLQYLQFVPFLNHQNVILRYDNNTSQTAQSVVNGMIGRLLAGSQSGNIQLLVFDSKDLGGTSNMFKMLDRHVYTICARTGDMQAQLSMLDRYVEDVVQNLLQGPYNTLAEFNKGKEKQEPYQIVVFKDFPYGVTPEMAHTIQRIIANGIRAGVQFIFMINDDLLHKNEDCIKIGNIMHLEDAPALQATTIDLTQKLDGIKGKQQYAVLDDNELHDIVQYVNAGFEIKTEEVLRLTDYMIPKDEWWTRQSANRVDIPFGMSSNKQIQKLNITQESGQNAAVVIGIPGSGKSVFLHSLIANAAINYSPRELQLYLLDFSGVEFDVYARHKLPHARVIAPEAEREFGLSILKEVFEESKRRMTLCREHGVTNIVELKQKEPELIVPRLLVIIDEFQGLFEIENDNISKEATTIIRAIIKEYRKFGINLILATQDLPGQNTVPYDLIANRIVFKSNPKDFDKLIDWPRHNAPMPRLLAGTCVYNNESGAEAANYLTRSFFINASKELEDLLDEVSEFAKDHPEMTDGHELRTFRSEELPEFKDRILSDRHYGIHQEAPREVGVYLGESIAIAPCHVYVPLTKDSNNNILIIGGVSNVAKGIAYHALLSEITVHAEGACNVILMNFMMDDDPMQSMFQSDMFAAVSDYCTIKEAKSEEDVRDFLRFIKENVIDARKNAPSMRMTHFFINIFEFQRGRMFDGTGGRGDMQSECSWLLEYIMKNGPMVGVFTVLQVDNLANLNRLCYGAQNMFCHRITLQMSEQDSDKVVGNSAANKLLVLNRPATNYRALYYNHVNNSITKFKPYRYGINSK